MRHPIHRGEPRGEHNRRDVRRGQRLGHEPVDTQTQSTSCERRLTRAALVAYLVYAVPHLVYHVSHLMRFSPGDAVAQAVALLIAVVIPLALLAGASRPPRAPLVD